MTQAASSNTTALQPLAIDVVSVQSQVVYGSVGNNVAVPTFEARGLRVAAVPTVVLSNTPHYASVHGGALPLEWFSGYLADLDERAALTHLRAIVCGYLGEPAQAAALARWIGAQLAARPQLRVHVDPVIGDHDHGVYVAPGMIEAYREHLLPLAHGLTPNGFELEQLTGLAVARTQDVIAAARTLLHGRTQWIAVTSAAPAAHDVDRIGVVVVTREDACIIEHARIDAAPKGTGDLFSAVLTAQSLLGMDLFAAARDACDAVVAAIEHTRARSSMELLLPRGAERTR